MEEEIALLEEQLATAHADIDRLQRLLGEVETKAVAREAESAELRGGLMTVRQEAAEREALVADQAAQMEALQASAADAEARASAGALRYREMVLAAEPDLPPDLVGGDSVDAVDESLARARQTVAQVRQRLEQQAQALRIPPGAPARTGPDLAGLSATEKIRLGLQQG